LLIGDRRIVDWRSTGIVDFGIGETNPSIRNASIGDRQSTTDDRQSATADRQ
jgi:hypothetical protein